MNRLAAALALAGLVVLAGPTLLNASHPPVKAHVEATVATTDTAFPETPSTQRRFPETTSTQPSTSTVPTVTSTTVVPTTVVPVDTQEVRFPLTQVLPFETPTWRIDYRINTQRLTLVITLMALTNRAEQVPARRAQLVQAKAEALAWLMERGGTRPSDHPITWIPAEAATL